MTDLFRAAGWSYLGIFRKNFFVFATADRAAQAHTDPDVLDYAIRRFFKQKLLGGIGLAIVNFLLYKFLYPFSNAFSLSDLRYFWAEALADGPSPGCWPCWAFCWWTWPICSACSPSGGSTGGVKRVCLSPLPPAVGWAVF